MEHKSFWPLVVCVLFLCLVTVNGATNVCATGDEPTVFNTVNSSSAGDTVVIPPGTNHYWFTLLITNNIILKYAGADLVATYGGGLTNTSNGVTVVQNTYVQTPDANCSWIVNDLTNPSSPLIQFSTASNTFQPRITGGSFLPGTNVSNNNKPLILFRGDSWMCRADNLHLYLPGQNGIGGFDNTVGVVDHCALWERTEFPTFFDHATWAGQLNGDGSWNTPDSFGQTNEWYVETCISTNYMNGSDSICDCQNGARYCIRYNTITNAFIGSHGTETGQRSRGLRTVEAYENYMYTDTNNPSFGLYDKAAYIRGGSMLLFSNYMHGFKHPAQLASYRAWYGSWNIWHGANGTNSWDTNDTSIVDSGTHNGSNSGGGGTPGAVGVLTDTTKSWIINQFAPSSNGLYVVVNETLGYSYGNITTNSATQIAYSGIVDGGGISTNFTWRTGDSYNIYLVRAILDEPGRGVGDLLTNNPAVNATLGGIIAWPRQALDPCYQWSNTMVWEPRSINDWGPVGFTTSPQTGNIVTNKNFYDFVVKPSYTPAPYPSPLVSVSDPFITSQPLSQTVTAPATATFTVTASTVVPPLTYQWSKNGSSISGATQSSYTTPATVIGDNGALFSVQVCNNTNACITSSIATLTVNAPAPPTSTNTATSVLAPSGAIQLNGGLLMSK